MSESAETEVVETEVTAKKEKAPKPQPRIWVGATASRDGTVYNRLQHLVAANPGLERDTLIKTIIDGGFAAKNSAKFEENPTQFIGSYLTAGERKGFFTFDESKAQEAPTVTTVTKKAPAEKGPSVTESGRAILETLRSGLGDSFAVGQGLPLSDIMSALSKTKAQLSRSLDKLVKEKYVETDNVKGDDDKEVTYVYVEQAGYDLLTAAGDAE